jgi:hypothetical protein
MVDCALYLGGVIVEERDEACCAVQHCCAEMEALMAWCNAIVEGAEDMEEFDRMTSDAEHVRLRYEILEHICGGE